MTLYISNSAICHPCLSSIPIFITLITFVLFLHVLHFKRCKMVHCKLHIGACTYLLVIFHGKIITTMNCMMVRECESLRMTVKAMVPWRYSQMAYKPSLSFERLKISTKKRINKKHWCVCVCLLGCTHVYIYVGSGVGKWVCPFLSSVTPHALFPHTSSTPN